MTVTDCLNDLVLFSNPGYSKLISAPVIFCTWAAVNYFYTDIFLRSVKKWINLITECVSDAFHFLSNTIWVGNVNFVSAFSLPLDYNQRQLLFLQIIQTLLYRGNKNCRHAEFTPDKQHPRRDLTLQFALTHRRQILTLFRYISSTDLFCKSIMQHKIVAPRLVFCNCPELESSKKKKKKNLWCDRVFMENLNEGGHAAFMPSNKPQGLGNIMTLLFYNHWWSAHCRLCISRVCMHASGLV